MSFVEGVVKGYDIAGKRRKEKTDAEQQKKQNQQTDTQQGFQGLEILNALSQHEATADAALDGLIAKRSALVQEEAFASELLTNAEMTKQPGAMARAQQRHDTALNALSELDSFLSSAAKQREAFGQQSAMTRDFLTRNGLLNGLLDAKNSYEQLNQPSQSQVQPAPFTMAGSGERQGMPANRRGPGGYTQDPGPPEPPPPTQMPDGSLQFQVPFSRPCATFSVPGQPQFPQRPPKQGG